MRITPDKHKLCEPCRRDFRSKEALTTHWKTDEVHKETYDSICNRLFDTPVAKQQHVSETPSKHNPCSKCETDFKSSAQLKYHWESTLAHVDTYCQECQHDFLTPQHLEKVVSLSNAYIGVCADALVA